MSILPRRCNKFQPCDTMGSEADQIEIASLLARVRELEAALAAAQAEQPVAYRLRFADGWTAPWNTMPPPPPESCSERVVGIEYAYAAAKQGEAVPREPGEPAAPITQETLRRLRVAMRASNEPHVTVYREDLRSIVDGYDAALSGQGEGGAG